MVEQAHSYGSGDVLEGCYQLETLIGKGGFGEVFAARHLELDVLVAVKILNARPDLLGEDRAGFFERFRREARIAAKVRHRHVATVHHYGLLPGDRRFLVMELLRGNSLAALLSPEGAAQCKLPVDRCLRIAQQVCDGLTAVHAMGIVHRDLKPDNIFLVDEPGTNTLVKILDFGIAKAAGPASTPALTAQGSFTGSAQYASPEHCKGEPVDARSDLYSLGVVLYEMATGTLPFMQSSPLALFAAHIHLQPTPPRQVYGAQDLPHELEQIILRCLAKNPHERYQDAAALRAALAQLASPRAATPVSTSFATSPTLPAVTVPAVTTEAGLQRGPRVGVLALALGALALVVAGSYALTRTTHGPEANAAQPTNAEQPANAVQPANAAQPVAMPTGVSPELASDAPPSDEAIPERPRSAPPEPEPNSGKTPAPTSASPGTAPVPAARPRARDMAPPAEQRGSGETHSEPTLFFDLSRFADPTLNAAPQQFVRALADTRWKLADSAASATYIVRVQEPAIRDAGIDNETGMHVRVVTGRVLLVDGEHRVRDLGTVRGVGKARGAGPAVELAIRELAQRAIGAVGSRG